MFLEGAQATPASQSTWKEQHQRSTDETPRMDLQKSPTYPKVPKIYYQDSTIISKKKQNTVIEEFLWEIGSFNTSLELKSMTYIQREHIPL